MPAESDRVAAPAPPPGAGTIALPQAQALVSDLFARRAVIYWSDFLGSLTSAYACAAWYLMGGDAFGTRSLAFLIAGLLLYRAGTFIHEIVHFSKGSLPGFRTVWNLLFGIPLCLPWQFYRSHIDHHNRALFATPRDAEYLPLALGPWSAIARYLAQIPLLAPLLAARFAFVPLTWLHPRLRREVLERASAFGINPQYRWRHRSDEHARGVVLVEWSCFAWLALVAGAIAAGVIGWRTIALLYALITFTLGLNWVRTLAAHRYDNAGEPVSLTRQVTDSINLTGQPWLTAWLFPVGLQYHALHHLFPQLPYHVLGRAHQRLIDGLPPDSAYRRSTATSFGSVLAALWASARRPHAQTRARARALWHAG